MQLLGRVEHYIVGQQEHCLQTKDATSTASMTEWHRYSHCSPDRLVRGHECAALVYPVV